MKRYLLTLFFIATLLIASTAQDKRYFNKHFQKASRKATENFRIYEFRSRNSVFFQDFVKDNLTLEGTVYNVDNADVMDEFIYFIRNQRSSLNYSDTFKNLKGDFNFYQENGRLFKTTYEGSNLKYYHAGDSNTPNVLTNGNGTYQFQEGVETRVMNFQDSLITTDILITEKNDTIFNNFDTVAEPPDGMQNFYQSVVKKVRYPLSQIIAGQEAEIYIQFEVDAKGRLINFKARDSKGNTTKFEEKTIKKLSKFPSWMPAKFQEKPVTTRFLLPVYFQLN